MATLMGLEPVTFGVTGRRANQLRYRAILVNAFQGVFSLSLQLHIYALESVGGRYRARTCDPCPYDKCSPRLS